METFRVIFKGGIAAGHTPDQVKNGLAKLFKLDLSQPGDASKLKQLLSGKAGVVKSGLTRDQARQYQDVISQAGALTEVGPDPRDRFFAPGVKERRQSQRRLKGDRRSVRRASSILPDRRRNNGRRVSDPGKE